MATRKTSKKRRQASPTKRAPASEPKEGVMSKALGPAAEDFGEAVKPLGKPAGELVVKAVEGTAKGIKNAGHLLKRIGSKVWGFDEIWDWLKTDVEEKLKNVPDEDRIEPKPHIAGPAIEAMRYVGDEHDLRDLFGNLLATSMDAKTASQAHPAFVEILKQLSPDEAKILKYVSQQEFSVPIIEIRSVEKINKQGMVWREHDKYFTTLAVITECQHPQLEKTYIENLCRLQICRVPDDKWSATNERSYEALEKHPSVVSFGKALEAADRELVLVRKSLLVTEFGKQFLDACVRPKE